MRNRKGKVAKFKGSEREGRLDSPVVIGRNAVREVLRQSPERVRELLVTDQAILKDVGANDRSQPSRLVEADELGDLVGSGSHQGVAALLTERRYLSVDEFVEGKADAEFAVVVALDDISDPHNVGAILRAAECFGVDGVVFSKNRGAGITPTVTKVSVGASELVPLIRISNLAESLVRFSKAGYQVVTLELSSNSQALYDADLGAKVVVVAGSEHDGVQPLISKRADLAVSIPMFGSIDSLNVSQAIAVVLSELRRRQGGAKNS